MTNISRKRQFDYLKLEILNHLKSNKWIYIALFTTLIIGIIIGVITIGNIGPEFEIGDLRDKILLDYLKGDNSWVGYLLLKFFECLLLIVIICFFSLKKWMILGQYLLILINGYFIGINCTIIIFSLGFIGIIYTLLIIAPCYILTNILLICISIEGYTNLSEKCSYTYSRKNRFIKIILSFSILMFAIKFCEMLLISIFITRFLILV